MIKNLQEICTSLSYEIYEVRDMANPYELNTVINSFNSAKEYFKDYDFSKKYDLDTIADYYLVKKICAYRKFLPYLKDEDSKKIVFLDYYDDIIKKYKDDNIADFYNAFDFKIPTDYYGLVFVIYEDLPNRLSALKEETFANAIKASPYLILNYYSKYNNVFSKYKTLYNILFDEKNFNGFIENFDSRFLEVATKICKDKNFFDNEIKNKIIKKFVDLADKIVSNKDLKKALHYQIMYKEILNFFKNIAYSEYDKYKTEKATVDALSDQWIEKDGQSFSYEIPYKKFQEILDNKKIDPVDKQISLTHSKYNGELSHYCISAMRAKKDAIFDFVSTPNEHNEHFPLSVIQAISISHQVYGVVFQLYLKDDNHRNDFIGLKNSFTQYIYNALNINIKSIESQIFLLDNNIEKFVQLWKIKDLTLENKEQAQDCGWKVIQFIELLLRNIYVAIKNEKGEYCDKEKLTLGTLIDYRDPKNAFKGVLSDEFLQYLNYMLTMDKDDKGQVVGYNMRNNVAHGNQNVENYNIGDTLLCIMLLTGIINSLFIHYNKIVVERNLEEKQRRDKISEVIKRQNETYEKLKSLEKETKELRQQLSEAQSKIKKDIIYPETLQEFANSNLSIEELKDSNKVKELREYLTNYVKEKLEGTDDYKKYKEILAENDKKELEFCFEFIKSYIEIDLDRKELFSAKYFDAIEELAKEGLFYYNLRTPDIPEKLLFENKGEKRIQELTELYSMQLRKIYRNIINRGGRDSKDISEIIDFLEDEQFENCYNKLKSTIEPEITILKKSYSFYTAHEKENGSVQFIINGQKQNIRYYITATEQIISYWDEKVSKSITDESIDELKKYSKTDCVKLLLMLNNIKEFVSLLSATNFILKNKKYLQQIIKTEQ